MASRVMHSNHGNAVDQDQRDFFRSVDRHFSFLKDYGYIADSRNDDDDVAIYMTPSVSLTVFQGFALGDVGLRLVSSLPDTAALSLDDLEAWLNIKAPPMQARSREYTEYCVAWIAQLLRAHCADLLKGDKSDWRAVTISARHRAEAYNTAQEISDMRRVIPGLQEAQDYKRIVKIMSPLEPHLTAAESKLLSVARKRLREQ